MKFLLLAALAAAACGGSPAPTTPSLPKALLQDSGKLTITCSSWDCSWEGQVSNAGQGCASNIGGTAKFMDANQAIMHQTDIRADSALVRPGSTVRVWGPSDLLGPRSLLDARYHKLELKWDDVVCH